jgi:hypothetical protein
MSRKHREDAKGLLFRHLHDHPLSVQAEIYGS